MKLDSSEAAVKDSVISRQSKLFVQVLPILTLLAEAYTPTWKKDVG